MSEEDAEADSEAYDWWRWWHLLPMLALGVQAVLHTPVPGELFENAGRAFGAGIVVPVAAGASRWVVAKLGGVLSGKDFVGHSSVLTSVASGSSKSS